MDDYLESLEFSNFQSLKAARIDLSPHFNVIVGPSNLGKSAALRAIRALMRNAPTPGLLREGAKQFDLKACFSNGTTVQLTKGKNKSVFTVNGEEYAKSGVKAPEAVVELWAMSAPDGRELSYATQHEPPFLLAEPASGVAKVLGDLTNAAVLMEAVGKANRMRTEALNDVKARTREAEEARSELMSHAGLSARTKAVEAAREALRAAQAAYSQWEDIDAVIRRADMLTSELTQLEVQLSKNLELDSVMDEADAALVRWQEIRQLLEQEESLRVSEDSIDAEIAESATIIKTVEERIHELLEEAGVCPVCGSVTK